MDEYLLLFPLQADIADTFRLKSVLDQLQGGIADQNPAEGILADLLVVTLQPGRDIYRIADGSIFEPLTAPQ